MSDLNKALENNPVIAAIKGKESLDKAIRSSVDVIFLLGSNICELKEIVRRVTESGKQLYIHTELIEGMGRDSYALQFLSEYARPTGIITIKHNLVKPAQELGFTVIQRVFMLDSLSFDNSLKIFERGSGLPDAIEILPGLIWDIIKVFSTRVNKPVIAGGLIRSKEDMVNGLNAGAAGISTTNSALWDS